MKTILYSLIAIILFGSIVTGFINKANTKNNILIQSVDNPVSSDLLHQSAKIISGRLKDFSSEKFDITVIPEKNQIQVIVADAWDSKIAENLLTQKGTIAFYETYNRQSTSELLNGDNQLFSLFTSSDADNLGVTIGCISAAEAEKVTDYVNATGLNQVCKFAWSRPSENSDVCLYALRLVNGDGVLLKGTDIESFKFQHDTAMGNNYIEFQFKKPVIGLWSDITSRNINSAIAIVLDNNVIYAPVVKSVIENGICSITGNFTETQVRYIAALGNNGELPLSFTIVK